jgi:thioredoxin 1
LGRRSQKVIRSNRTMPRFDMPVITNDSSIDRVLGSGLPVALVIWRGARLDPSLDETLRQVARSDAGRLLVARLNADENPHTAARANGTPLPALLTYRGGQEVARAGQVTSAAMRDHVNYLLERGPAPETHTAPTQQTPPPDAPTRPVTVTDASFQRDVLDSDLPVLVDLWAPWCGPCRMIAPILEQLAGEYAGKLKIAKLNVDENPRTAGSLRVMGIPTLLIYRNGREVDRIVGAAPEPMLRARLRAVLSSR